MQTATHVILMIHDGSGSVMSTQKPSGPFLSFFLSFSPFFVVHLPAHLTGLSFCIGQPPPPPLKEAGGQGGSALGAKTKAGTGSQLVPGKHRHPFCLPWTNGGGVIFTADGDGPGSPDGQPCLPHAQALAPLFVCVYSAPDLAGCSVAAAAHELFNSQSWFGCFPG